MEFNTTEDFQEFEYQGRLFELVVDVNFEVEPAQNGGLTDPSWSAYPYIDGQELVSIVELDDDGEEIEVDDRERVLYAGRFVFIGNRIAEEFVEKHGEKMTELYKEFKANDY